MELLFFALFKFVSLFYDGHSTNNIFLTALLIFLVSNRAPYEVVGNAESNMYYSSINRRGKVKETKKVTPRRNQTKSRFERKTGRAKSASYPKPSAMSSTTYLSPSITTLEQWSLSSVLIKTTTWVFVLGIKENLLRSMRTHGNQPENQTCCALFMTSLFKGGGGVHKTDGLWCGLEKSCFF